MSWVTGVNYQPSSRVISVLSVNNYPCNEVISVQSVLLFHTEELLKNDDKFLRSAAI